MNKNLASAIIKVIGAAFFLAIAILFLLKVLGIW